MAKKQVVELEEIAIRFTGDSGDGMQVTGGKFSESTMLAGNDLSTLPDYPAEIRAPAGTLAGVSGFQIHFASRNVHTPADQPDVLVAFNPAALKTNIADLRPGGTLIVNQDAFKKRALARAEYEESPLPGLRDRFNVVELPLTQLNRKALEGIDLGSRDIDRCKNFFVLGIMFWMYGRDLDPTQRWLRGRFRGEVREANLRALESGHAYGETTELLPTSYQVPAAKIPSGTYRNITGNAAFAWGIVAAGVQMDRQVFLGAYPITPASDILHEVARYGHFGIKTMQAEDEIAACSAAIGAAFAGSLAVTCTSGPGLALKQEAINLAVMAELPLVILDIQRGGPSTGMPTKVEQGDLPMALYGRNSDSPMPVLAASSPGDCFHTVFEAFRWAVKYMTPVVVLSDSYLANGTEPWLIPDIESLPRVSIPPLPEPESFQPYRRDPKTLARPWAVPGTPGLEHRIGGLSTEENTGNVSYDPDNNERMMHLRDQKVAGIVADIPPLEVVGNEQGELLVVGWGRTRGASTTAVEAARAEGLDVSRIHLRHINPFPPNLGEILGNFRRILVPEINLGHLTRLLRAEFLVPAEVMSKTQGKPFKVGEIRQRIDEILSSEDDS